MLPSAMSTFRPCKSLRAGAAGCKLELFNNFNVNQKQLPVPISLVKPIWPSIRSTNFLHSTNPKPVPPYLRVMEASAWEKTFKEFGVFIFGDADSGVGYFKPKQGVGRRFFNHTDAHDHLSFGGKLKSMPTRLERIWRNLPGSPRRFVGTS